MDMKKKLEDAYTPDKHARREKVLIGLSGGLDSYVTAYLLKIQKYDLVAATVVNAWDNWEGNNSSVLSCHIDQPKLDGIRDFCHRLNIPHYIIKNSSEFKEGVIEGWVADRLSGRFPRPCWSCHEMRMRHLHQKMTEIGARHLATGHFAKLFQQDGGSIFIHTSNDDENDQSALLSRVPHDVLKSLLLPLSDLTKKEVIKLAENFGVIEETKKVKTHECLSWRPEMKPFFEKNVAPKFLQGGEVIGEDGHAFPSHEGVFEHTYGESYDYRDTGQSVKGFLGSYSSNDRTIHVMEESYFTRNKIHLTNCHFSEGTNWLEPMRGFVVVGNKAIECWLHPKSLTSAYIEMAEPAFIKEGDVLSVIKKKGKNSKVYLTGKVHFLPQDPIITEGEASVPQVDRSRDY